MHRTRDVIGDLIIDFSAKRTRILLFLTAVALSTGSLVTAVGVSQMAAHQIDADIAAAGTNMLAVEVESGVGDVGEDPVFPISALERVSEIDGVVAAGLRLPISDGMTVMRNGGGQEISNGTGQTVEVAGVTSGYLAAYDVEVQAAWLLDADPAYDVAVIGALLAEQIGVPAGASDYTGYRFYLDGRPYEVIGIAESGPLAATSVAVPYRQALDAVASDRNGTMLVRTEPGAGWPVSGVIGEAIRPDRPDMYRVSSTADLRILRTGVSTQLARLAGAVGALLLILTTFLIANSMIGSVASRTAEIGLRRALGASSGGVAMLFLADGGLTGIVGGLGGSALGSVAVVVVAAMNGWSALLYPWYALAGPGIGLVVGVIASAYPAVRAARIAPAEAVRAE